MHYPTRATRATRAFITLYEDAEIANIHNNRRSVPVRKKSQIAISALFPELLMRCIVSCD